MAECPGVYRLSEMRDGALARVRIPGGHLTAGQLRTVANLAGTYGSGKIDLTNRANIQIRGLRANNTQDIADTLRDCGLLCANPDVDRARNITASPLAGIDDTEFTDVTQLVDQLDDALQNLASTYQLSPKFAFVIDGGGRTSLANIGHDMGFFATQTSDLLAISLAGHMTARAITKSNLVAFVQTTIAYISQSGQTRMKDVLANRQPLQVLEDVAQTAGMDLPAISAPASTNGRPLPLGHHQGQSMTTSWYCVGVPLAQLTANQAQAIANISDLGNGTIRLTPWQSIVFPHVSQKAAEDMELGALRHGLQIKTPAFHIVACTGCTGCERTKADTKADGQKLINTLANWAAPGESPPIVHLSGCQRGCAHPNVSDILALADDGSANYTIHAGSRPSPGGIAAPIKAGVPPEMLAECIANLDHSK